MDAKKPTVMVVDDNDTIREMVVRVLRQAVSTMDFDNAEDAFIFYKNNKAHVDIVLTDMRMPGMDGYDLFFKLREFNPAVKVVAMTGEYDEGKLQELREAGILDVWTKPMPIDTIAGIVEHLKETPA